MSAEAPLLRVFPELRAAHIERATDMLPGTTLYFSRKYDLGATPPGHEFVPVSLLQAIVRVARSRAKKLELPEPLWLRYYPGNFVLGVVWRVSGLLQGKRRSASAYSIENNDIDALLFSGRSVPALVRRIAVAAFGLSARAVYGRLAYGSDGARETYESIPFLRGVTSRTFLELPAPRSIVNDEAQPGRAVFVGRLEDRKGIERLMDAWPAVEEAVPGAVLEIVGDGPLGGAVTEWCRQNESQRISSGALDHATVLRRLQEASVLVAPSQRDGRWREQIGLPISEALSTGLTIVTTSETGLAEWLLSTGHHVVSADRRDHTALSRAIIGALEHPLDRASVLGSLPSVLGRIEADAWLNS
ncbi:glycosyltransferase family 4 protein [Okibacterium fritillariae]|uniref:glycosyltransferase family 4 protein n=1 Tax=Okibacterium fritillariae TaxID=123320 RepID=UPI004055676A